MKNLPQMVDDLRTLSAFLLDGASDLEELMQFLGGAVNAPRPRPPATPPPPPPPPPAPLPAPVHANEEGEPEKRPRGRPRGPRVSGVRKGGEPRILSEAEKAAIRADWESLPNHQRTAINRTALSLKHRCSVQQFFALTRSDGHLQEMGRQALEKLALQRSQSPSETRETR